MKIYDISKEIMATPPYGDDPAPSMRKLATFKKNGYNLSQITMSLHAATHGDAPLHFIRDGADIAEMPLDAYLGPCRVLSVPNITLDAMFFMRFPKVERLLLHGDGELTESGIGYLYNNGLKLIGTDRDSIGSPSNIHSIHVAVLGYKIAVLENLNLDGIPDGEYFLSAAPLKIHGAEGAPCRAVLFEQ